MERIRGALRDYAWGSPHAIPEVLGIEAPGHPVAEYWLGAHPDGPATMEAGVSLPEFIAADPTGTLGDDVVARFGAQLPFLMKLIAPEKPLSLQVHPDPERARRRFAQEEAAGIAPELRNYKDPNHKPELVYALSTFHAMSGFRAPRRVAELLADLDAALARELREVLRSDPSPGGVRKAFTALLSVESRPSADEIQQVAVACQSRLGAGSPSPRTDATVVQLAQEYPGDPGVVISLLLNPVTLQPGEAMFVPAGGVHAYLSGCAVEVMASSDNVLRAGLTSKHIDIPEMIDAVDFVAAPPIRIAPERFHDAAQVFYAPVDDFRLAIATVDGNGTHAVAHSGPRIALCLAGELALSTPQGTLLLRQGEAVFVPADDGPLAAGGTGELALAAVP